MFKKNLVFFITCSCLSLIVALLQVKTNISINSLANVFNSCSHRTIGNGIEIECFQD